MTFPCLTKRKMEMKIRKRKEQGQKYKKQPEYQMQTFHCSFPSEILKATYYSPSFIIPDSCFDGELAAVIRTVVQLLSIRRPADVSSDTSLPRFMSANNSPE
jgi:hypothetical protein